MNKFEELVKKSENVKNLKITIKNTDKHDDSDGEDLMEGIETEIVGELDEPKIIIPNKLNEKKETEAEAEDEDEAETEFHVNLDKVPPSLQNTILNEKVYINESFDKTDNQSKLDIDLDFISEPNLALLYDSLNLADKNFVCKDAEYDIKDPNLYRKDSLHIFGVDNLKTDEIFDFFKLYKPFAIEWINDSSCNLVWKNEIHAANALLYMTRPYDTASLNNNKKERLPPQGSKWRKSIDLAHGKYQLYMRFVRVKTDRKIKGAESRSKFYVRNGNPNFGNIKGLISSSKRREMKEKQINRATSDLELDDTANGRHLVSYDDVIDDSDTVKVVIESKVEKRKNRFGLYSDELRDNNDDNNDDDEHEMRRKKSRFEPYARIEKSRTTSNNDPNDLRNKLNRMKRLSSNY